MCEPVAGAYQASIPPPPTSGAQVAQTVCAVEVCRMNQWIEVYPAVNHVSMQLAAAGTGSASAMVTAFDGGGSQVATTTATVQRASFTPISLAAGGNATTIAYVEISGGHSGTRQPTSGRRD